VIRLNSAMSLDAILPARLLVLIAAAYLAPISAKAQTSAAILGRVMDERGEMVVDATVTLRNVWTGARRTQTTDSVGRYTFAEIPPGNYELNIGKAGFASQVWQGIVLAACQNIIVDISLKAGTVSEVVLVKGDAPLLNTSSSEVSALVNSTTIVNLPLNGRDLFQLATLQIGVVNVSSLVADPIKAGAAEVQMAINGVRQNFNLFLLDGTSINDYVNGTPGSFAGGFAGVDATEEFQLMTSSYKAEYGGAGGGVISIVTKSGSNEVHGSAYEFLRNSAFDARNFFDLENIPEFRRNQFGGAIGGPIKRNETFFFVNYEGLREILGETQRFAIPTPAAIQSASPLIRPYLNLYPAPNAQDIGGGEAFYIRGTPETTVDNHQVVRVDQQFNKDSLFARYLFDQSNQLSPSNVIQNTSDFGRDQFLGLGETHVFSSVLLNTFRFGFNRTRADGTLQNVVPVPPSLVFVPGAKTLGDIIVEGGPAPLSDNLYYPRPIVLNNFEYADQAAYSRGSHQLKFGFTGQRLQENVLSNDAPDGAYIFPSYAAFLLAEPSLFFAPFPQSSDVYRGIRENLFASFAQDDWRVSRRLTLNLGLRYEPITVPTEVNGKVSNMRNPNIDKTSTVGDPFFLNPSKKDLAPRIGFAWDVFGNGDTSVRGGFGIFYQNPLPNDIRYPMSQQPPFFNAGVDFLPPVPFPNAFAAIGADVLNLVPIQIYEYNPKPTYIMQWNLAIDRQIGWGTNVHAGYVGSAAVHLLTNGDVNTSAAYTILPDGEKFFPPNAPARNPNFGGPISEYRFNGNSNYNALQVAVERRFADGLQFHLAYTYSHSIDDASDGLGGFLENSMQYPQDAYNLAAERASSIFDIRHNFAADLIYELPFKVSSDGDRRAARLANVVVAGWQLNMIFSARSGLPFTPTIGSFNNSRDGNTANYAERPNYAPGFSGNAVTGNPARYINLNAFVLAPAGEYGNVGRNVLEGPGLLATDLSLFKTLFNIEGRLKGQFRAEAFNVLNRANFALPGDTTVVTQGGVAPPDAGVITSTVTPSRQLQFALKLIF
jgi:outer membrane receptor protein involved in Fe transport